MLLPDPRPEDISAVRQLLRKAHTGWYIGDGASLAAYGGRHVAPARTHEHELMTSLLFSRDRMHHSVGWWRNAEYEYCYHLSMTCWSMSDYKRGLLTGVEPDPVEIPAEEIRFWSLLIFGPKFVTMAWHEPGGTDPRLTPREARRRRHMQHLRVFMNPLTFQPFIPKGEVYTLTRWIPGLTPEKVDR